jgi:sterol desaturase/sphingolipid hydroxylase (fatty acid hydroxylase superfamily)
MLFTLFCMVLCVLAFNGLARMAPCNPGQPRFAWNEIAVDAVYFLISLALYGGVSAALMHWSVDAALGARAPAAIRAIEAGYGPMPALPLALQALIILILTDICQYWLHRLFHGHALWPFHAVHHSPRHVDWTTTYRVHPVQFLIYSAGVAALVKTLGFSPMVYVVLGPFNLFMGALVHANLDWTYGPFRYVIASPVFHRWHHVDDPDVRDKNFAPTFPVLDLMFGTFHMPVGQRPQVYGAEGAPEGVLGQMAWPFQVLASRFRPKAGPRLGAPAA